MQVWLPVQLETGAAQTKRCTAENNMQIVAKGVKARVSDLSYIHKHLLSLLTYSSKFPSGLSSVLIRHSKERSGIRKSKKAFY